MGNFNAQSTRQQSMDGLHRQLHIIWPGSIADQDRPICSLSCQTVAALDQRWVEWYHVQQSSEAQLLLQ